MPVDQTGLQTKELTMKNKLSDLNNHLFAQLERLSDESITGHKLEEEVIRAKAVSNIAKDIIGNANTVLKATELKLEHGLKETPVLIEAPKDVS